MSFNKIDILIAHYKESIAQVERLLNSINNQNINFNSIHVYMFNDGYDYVLDENIFSQYKFNVTYKVIKHCGTSKIRNKLFDESKSKYLWYLDSDDFIYENSLEKILPILDTEVDLISVGCMREQKNYTAFYLPKFKGYSIVGCNIFKRQFMIDNNLRCDENATLAGDVFIETMPKWYTTNKIALNEKVLHYSYNPNSVVRQKENNGWNDEVLIVISHCIERLIAENREHDAYTEYVNYVLAYNNKYIHNKYKKYFVQNGLYDMNYEMDLR